MRLRSSLALFALTLAGSVWAQNRTSPSSSASLSASSAFRSTAASSSFQSARSSARPSLLASASSLQPNATSSSSAALASPSVLANGTTLNPDSSLSFPNGTTLYPNGTSASNETIVSNVLPYEIKLDVACGVMGGVLIVTGGPVAVLGGKNRWTSLFLLYFFVGAFVAAVIAIHFGVAVPENPPSATMRGIFVLVAVVAGALAGSIAVLMARWTRYGMGFIAGFAIGWWILSFRDNGLIDVSWGRLVLLLGCAALLFVIGLWPLAHNPVVVVSTAFVGSTALILGIDCFTRAGLKELYIWNLGIRSIFDAVLRQRNNQLILGDVGKVEIALIGVLSVICAAIQFRAWDHLRQPLPSLSRSSRLAQRERRAEEAEKRVTRHADELDEWEALHGKGGGMPKIERQRSGWASTSGSASVRDGTVPVLGQQMVNLSDDDAAAQQKTTGSLDEQENLLEEIQTIRKSIEALGSGLAATPSPTTPNYLGNPLHQSPTTSTTVLPGPVSYQPLHSRSDSNPYYPRQSTSSLRPASGAPTSEWDRYLESRKIVHPSSPVDARQEQMFEPSQNRRKSSHISVDGLMDPPSAGVSSLATAPRRHSNFNDASQIPISRPVPSRSLSRDELASRHSTLLRKMQQPATESFTVEQDKADRRQSQLSETLSSRAKSAVDVEGWRGSVVVDDKVRLPMGGGPSKP